MRILVTNDDGIESEGLHVLARALRGQGEVIVVAPDSEYSGAGAAIGPIHLSEPEVRSVANAPENFCNCNVYPIHRTIHSSR